jgi:hypothetical protein
MGSRRGHRHRAAGATAGRAAKRAAAAHVRLADCECGRQTACWPEHASGLATGERDPASGNHPVLLALTAKWTSATHERAAALLVESLHDTQAAGVVHPDIQVCDLQILFTVFQAVSRAAHSWGKPDAPACPVMDLLFP